MPVGERITATYQKTDNETANGNPPWYADADGNFLWSGGVRSCLTAIPVEGVCRPLDGFRINGVCVASGFPRGPQTSYPG